MAAQIRQEINILDSVLTSTTVDVTSDALVQLDLTQYNGTVTTYLEIVATNTQTSNRTVRLINGVNNDGTITVPASTASFTLFRSSAMSNSASTREWAVQARGGASGTLTVKSASIIIIQNATTLTNTETQIEIGNAATTTSITLVPPTNPKYWKYTAANWDGTKTFLFEATFKTGSTKCTATVQLQTSADILAPTWSDVTNGTVTTTSTTAARVRTTTAFTPVDGNWYRVAFQTVSTKETTTLYNAKVIIGQAEGAYIGAAGLDNNGVNQVKGSTGNSEATAIGFKINNNDTISAVKLRLKKTGTPTDTFVVDIVSSLDGSSLANATVAASSLTTSYAEYTLTFGSPVALTATTQYYIRCTRSPDTVDTNNYVSVDNTTATGLIHNRSSGIWDGGITTRNGYYILVGATGLTKLEPQYLLANTLFAAGTALQTFLTKWDSTEWDDGSGTTTYYFQAETADGSTSDVTLEQADGGGTVTNSTLTNIDNAQISSALTMPASENLDTKATTNAGDVAAARILVAYVFAADAGTTVIHRLASMGVGS